MCKPDSKTFGIDLDKLEQICIKENPSTVIFVQVLGVLHYKEKLLELQNKYGFFLIEDACASHGSVYKDGIKAGCIGDLSTISTYMGHSWATIEGRVYLY